MPAPVHRWLTLATLAPSPLNTQPWHFRVARSAIDLHADTARSLPIADPDGRERTIAVGCALLNLLVACAADDYRADVALLPDPAAPDLLARVTIADGGSDAALARLAPAILHRRSTRHALHAGPFPQSLRNDLETLAREAHLTLAFIESRADRQALADLVAEGDRRLHHDPAWRHEQAAWIRPVRAPDGLPASRLGGPLLRFLVDHFDFGATTAGRDEVYTLHAPAVAILATASDTPADWLRAGQALERLLLRAALDDIHAGYLQQPLQLADLRQAVAARFTPGRFPQLCIRLGRPIDDPPPRRRRTLAECAEFAPSAGP